MARRFIREWGAFRDTPFEYKKGETWDRMVHQGVHLLERFAQDNRIHIPHRSRIFKSRLFGNSRMPTSLSPTLTLSANSMACRYLMDWKTTTSRYPESPAGLLSLDPQLICYSWVTGISDVALVVFVRKHQPEIQYLKTSISEEQRTEFGRLRRGNDWAD